MSSRSARIIPPTDWHTAHKQSLPRGDRAADILRNGMGSWRFVGGFVVFMILPVYASLERMDVALIEAGKDLYHSPLRTFVTVTLPATRAGLYGGMLLVFLPALGDFVSAQLLGGSSTFMIGNLVQQQFTEGQNWPLGSAMTVAMMAALTVLMVVYLRATTSRAREL